MQAAVEALGLKVYTYTDGSKKVIVDPAKPLPKAIKADIARPAKQKIKELGRLDPFEATGAAKAASYIAHQRTGRNVVVILPLYGSSDGYTYSTKYAAWATGVEDGLTKPSKSPNLAKVKAFAKKWIRKQDRPETWDIVIIK